MSLRLHKQMAAFTSHVRPHGLVLDLGCGPGRDTMWLEEQGFTAIGLDLSASMLAVAKGASPAGRWLHADMRALPLHSGFFDGVWACASLLHIPRSEAASVLREARRVSKRSAGLFLDVQRGDGETRVADSGRERLFVYYRMDELAELISQAGFTGCGSASRTGPRGRMTCRTWLERASFSNGFSQVSSSG